MNNNLEERILKEVTKEIEAIIAQVKEEEGMANNISAISILEKVNKKIAEWEESAPKLLDVNDDKYKEVVKSAKSELVLDAKNEVSTNIASIVMDGEGDITSRINTYVNELKARGIDFINNQQEDILDTPSSGKKLARSLINETPTTPERRTYRSYESSCNDYGCSGGSSGCGGGGC